MFALFASFALSKLLIQQSEEKAFLSWMRRTNQIYSGDDYHLRFGIFLTNKRLVQEINSAKKSYTVELNKFASYTPAEYKALLGLKMDPTTKSQIKTNAFRRSNEADSVDWRQKGIVNEIKDQGACGSCWAFGTVQACESSYALTHGTLYSCSEQNLVDCVPNCFGCDGGFPSSAINYVLLCQNGELIPETDYPYTALYGKCYYDTVKAKGINKILSFKPGVAGDEDALKEMVSTGVCIVGIDAAPASLKLYKSGIYYEPDCSSEFLNHCVGLVGYGSETAGDYWIVRNSWGKTWGEEGYIRMSRNRNNNCGIASDTYIISA